MEQLIDFHAPEVQAVLETLLKDRSTGKNIIWATDPPEELQTVMYEPVTDKSPITAQQLRLTHYEVVLPRMMKQTDTQQQRTRKKGDAGFYQMPAPYRLQYPRIRVTEPLR